MGSLVEQRYWEDVRRGDTVDAVDFPMSLYRLIVIAAGDRDFTPIHHNPQTARRHGAPDVFVNNTALFAMWERTVREYIGPAGVIVHVRGFRMGTFNLVGETITVRGDVVRKWRDPKPTGKGHIELRVQTEVAGEVRVGPGSVIVSLPYRGGPADQSDEQAEVLSPRT